LQKRSRESCASTDSSGLASPRANDRLHARRVAEDELGRALHDRNGLAPASRSSGAPPPDASTLTASRMGEPSPDGAMVRWRMPRGGRAERNEHDRESPIHQRWINSCVDGDGENETFVESCFPGRCHGRRRRGHCCDASHRRRQTPHAARSLFYRKRGFARGLRSGERYAARPIRHAGYPRASRAGRSDGSSRSSRSPGSARPARRRRSAGTAGTAGRGSVQRAPRERNR